MLGSADQHNKILIAIVGPTAVGKTAMAIELAQYFDTEIISADSRQFYREMSIGTAKPTASELGQAPHHFIDSHSIEEDYSAGDFEKEALETISSLFKKKDIVIMVGGSGLFVRAVCEGLDNLPKALPETRERLNNRFDNEGIVPLQAYLKQVDPVYYDQVDISNVQRVIRALEVFETTGLPFSNFLQKTKAVRPFKIMTVGLTMDRTTLYERINMRVDLMVKDGLLDEVKSLISFKHKPALMTVGYSELFDFLDEKISWEEAIDKIKQNSRRYAKRQLTWFKKDISTVWFDPKDKNQIIDYIQS
ncbi:MULTISPECIES: tRNA (adenosine(37)-N6)-dimethylallyltransferase MiaA [unclassified Sphingobacterium]|uniref:tRNA (adenosine(37)-N6)-dimethylallyltransferase MiaA n=1 Tax=unclassified Sphingobacterium TaxID=2609468 RepID=UPI00104CCCD8|nr:MULTISPECIES: tRNA (adenosine(37)-N6)-dimethylallyltransferase MiaA [unclassified Sphingobacterium]MCS3553140.1 tRNA dimethylallyltransferase [Sphingobacterium sp. JUb21]TCR09650.1 tRNA dimethylallyltransferase [Sphingobacterium sp. JUb20]